MELNWIFDLKSHFQDIGHDIIYARKCCHLVNEYETPAAGFSKNQASIHPSSSVTLDQPGL